MGNLEAILELETRLENVADDFDDIFFAVSDQILELAEELQRDQLRKGENPEGIDLFSIRPYAPRTIAIKKGKGQPTNKVTFFDRGNLYRSIKAKKYKGFIELTANVPQVPELIAKWGEWEGLTDVHVEFLKEEMQPLIIEEIHRRLTL